tara:strand:+ start:3568 stop:3780 length:213 start_codon:yes stop_codon:yes gene_type:complete
MLEKKIQFDEYDDPFRAFNIHMAIICDLEQGGKLDEESAFSRIKDLYKEFKKYYKKEVKNKDKDERGYYK